MSTSKVASNGVKAPVRVAIYTRKSSEEGLAQEFNSLDAQREACEAYITSQRNEGWVCLPDRYDDGGFSGGNMERPGLQKLLRDIDTGRVDCIAVYKLDRLSRSLLDFAKLLEVFEKRSVAFVSVTQRFSTADSMGRLLLNVLLSFAQFEREIIGERIRDKIGAQRRKGRWTGGAPVLGYEVDRTGGSPRLVVNGAEAAQVREIFNLYMKLGSMLPVVEELGARGWRTKKWTTSGGSPRGDREFDKCSLYALLTNPIVAGRVRHKDSVFPGEHDAVVTPETFDLVQTQLKAHGRGGGFHLRNKHGALLRGVIYCKGCGRAMVHTFAARGATTYRYYTCCAAIKRGRRGCPTGSLPAGEIERAVVDEIRAIAGDPQLQQDVLAQVEAQQGEALEQVNADRRDLRADLARHQKEIHRIVQRNSAATSDTARLIELHEKVRTCEGRAAELDEAERRVRVETYGIDTVRDALHNFDAVWATLSPKEQARVIELLVQRVEYDRADSSIEIAFHDAGLTALGTLAAGSAA
jgi:site-specific DNA recombinase